MAGDSAMSGDEVDEPDTQLEPPQPAEIVVKLDGKTHHLAFEQAFALGCSLLEKGSPEEAAKLFERLEEFTDRGPRAFIMQAFCEAAAMHFDSCSKPLAEAFAGSDPEIVTSLHNAFISYHVGIRQEGLDAMVTLVNKHRDLPTLCLLLGNMCEAAGRLTMAKRCWALAVHRDRPGGAVAAVAMRHLRRESDESAPK
jgi:hypothetical protein